ncbi:MAG: RnfABCDGE type electron transport complex subunit D [Thermoplasmata archaeon]|nr:RnfABCDGE type electron transport complex subunit D [Thermoplasmata archaeon]
MSSEKGSEQKKLMVSPAPHLHAKRSTRKIMFLVCLALLLPTTGGVYYFGIYTLFVVLVSVVTCVLTEFAAKMLRKREFVMDGSAVVTGMLLALVLPPRIPLWAVVIGAAFSIAIVKEAFGGLGYNIFNPALAGRAFLSVSFAGPMTNWIAPVSSPMGMDSVTTATPLSESFVNTGSTHELYLDLFLGDIGGCIGETSVLLILIGGIILLATGVIKWRIPGVFIGTVFLLTWLIPGEDPIFHILAGGLFLGAFFMATDYVTAPLTDRGQFIFAAGAGVLVVMIRLYGSMPEGVAYSILLMNAFTPLIDRYARPKPYGYAPPEKLEAKEEGNKDDKPKEERPEQKESKGEKTKGENLEQKESKGEKPRMRS